MIAKCLIAEYLRNRPSLSAEIGALPPGTWLAVSADRRRIVASADDLCSLDQKVSDAGIDPEEVLFEKVGEDDLQVGESQLH